MDPFILPFVIIVAIASLIQGAIMTHFVLREGQGDKKMREIAGAIQEGASAYLNRQYSTIALVGLVILVALAELFSISTAVGFLIGAVLSGVAGYIGMHVSVRANVRTAFAAQQADGIRAGLKVSFRAGAVTGLLVAGLALLSVAGFFAVLLARGDAAHDLDEARHVLEGLIALGFGASLISIFARLGGGIFTKGADVGADLVGKIEAGIPEDDPRNPAVIADNVGDNVGDCAGMAADLFETYVVTLVATMSLATLVGEGISSPLVVYPLVVAAVCLIASMIGVSGIRLGKSRNIMLAFYIRFGIASLASIPLLYGATHFVLEGDYKFPLFICALIGVVVTALMIVITEYYTGPSFPPVKSIVRASATGHATNIIQGLAVSLEATAAPAIVIALAIGATASLAGLMGVAVAVTSMLAFAGLIVALDAYGPVTDNAGGIAEMAGLDANVRTATDTLDSVGNTTKAITKGYAIGSAGLGALVLFAAYTQDLSYYASRETGLLSGISSDFSLANPWVVVGFLVGAGLPYIFGAMAMRAVRVAASSVVREVRRQFKEIPGIMDGSDRPEYGTCVRILTGKAIRLMIIPALLPVVVPVAFVAVVWLIAGLDSALAGLGSLLLGVIATGFFVAISMTAGGGAWDNAKKSIEDREENGKGSEAHKAAITGDTVGDPYKDTAGPAINPMIKITNIVALLVLAFLAGR